jgi:non-specific serine/threonine protein kinase/serine/threonine-protein kinase
MAIEFVEGLPITVQVRSTRAPIAERLRLFGQVCDAVDYAHRNLVLHLDIKPGNILITRDGIAKLVDFGAGRSIDARFETGNAGMFTPGYAAPEQIAGGAVTTASDVFALGRVLADLAGADVKMPGALRADLDAIIAHATAPDPAARYVSAGALGADVARALAGLPIEINRDNRGYVLRRLLRRNRGWVLAGTALVISLVAGVVGTAIAAHRANVARDYLQAEVSRSDAVRDYLSLLLRHPETDAQGHPLSGPELLTRSAANLGTAYAHDPVHYAQITEYLMLLFGDMDNDEAEAALADRFLKSPAATAYPISTARIRYQYADALYHRGQFATAKAQLEQARAYWSQHDEQDRPDVARSWRVEGQILRGLGDIPGAIAAFRTGLALAQVTPGMNAADVPHMQNSLALTLAQDGQFDESERLLALERVFFEHEGRTADELVTVIQNQGAVALSKGDFPAARRLLTEAIDRRRRDFGPSAAMGAAQLQLAQLELISGNAPRAHAVAIEGLANATRFVGANSPLSLQAHVLEAASAAVAGEPGAAADVAQAMALTAKASPTWRALAMAAQARVSGGDGADARAMLASYGKADPKFKALLAAILKR